MKVEAVNASWRESQDFTIDRDDIGDRYIFIHYLTPAILHDGRKNGKTEKVNKGACIFYNKHSAQHFRVTEPLIHDWLHLTGNWDNVFKKYGLKFGTVYYPKNDDFVTEIIKEIYDEQMNQEDYYNEYTNLKVEQLICEIVRKSVDQMSFSEKFFKKDLQNIRNRIYTCISNNPKINDFASDIGLSPSRFYSLYKSFFGTTPRQDIINARINHAKFLLLQNRYSVEQVAQLCGYTNQFHFIRQFKGIVGVTPGKFR